MAALDTKRSYSGVFIGMGIRRDIGQEIIFRIRRGNGYYGANLGELYQDRYTYFVPTSITDAAGDASRTTFAAAVSAWQALSQSQKDVFNRLAQHIQYLTGFNLYIRRYMQENY